MQNGEEDKVTKLLGRPASKFQEQVNSREYQYTRGGIFMNTRLAAITARLIHYTEVVQRFQVQKRSFLKHSIV